MWKIKQSSKSKSQLSCRIPNENLDDFNSLAERFQDDLGYPFQNGFEFISELISRFHKLENENEKLISQVKSTVSPEKQTSIKGEITSEITDITSETNPDTSDFTSEINSDTAEINSEINSEITPATSSIIDEIKTLVYDGIPKNEIPSGDAFYNDLLDVIKLSNEVPEPEIIEKEVEIEVERKLDPGELLLNLKEKQLRMLQMIARWRHSKGKDKEKLSVSAVIKRMLFNEGALTNVHGEFETGIRSKRFKTFKKNNEQ